MAQPFAQNFQSNEAIVLAQLGTETIDLDPPDVDHVPVTNGIAGAPQSISVKAADAQGVASVTLLYRYSTAAEYKRVLMRPVSGTDNYTVTLEPGTDQNIIEYYFLVIDTGGNKVLSGFPYQPFTRTFIQQLTIENLPLKNQSEPALPSQPVQAGTELDSTPVTLQTPPAKSTNVMWIALGVLVLGVLAASSSGDKSTTGGETVPVIFDIPVP